MYFIRRHFVKILVAVLLIKIGLLFWSAHPYDFWALVESYQRALRYEWSPFYFWNKGNLLIGLWYPIFGLYVVLINILNLIPENLLLLHFLFKLPFLSLDLASAYIIYKIVLRIFGNRDKALVASLMWYVNPIIYYIYGIHGHYELVIPFAILLTLWSLLIKRPLLLALGVVILITTKVFFILFIPFLLIYQIKNWGKKAIILSFCYGLLFWLNYLWSSFVISSAY